MTLNEDIKKLVIARLDVLPKNKKISIGSKGDYTAEQLIQHVKDEDSVGKMFVEIELGFLRALKKGILT